MKKLDQILIDLVEHKIRFQFHRDDIPLVIHFDTPSRKFYFSLIALIVYEMKQSGHLGFVYIRKHEQLLKFLDDTLAGTFASKTISGMWEKIRRAWHYSLPNLEEAANFKIEGRDLVSPYEKGGKYLYECTEDECDAWANLFGIDDITNKWRYRFAVELVGLNLNDISLGFGNLKDDEAWQAFLKNLKDTTSTGKVSAAGELETTTRPITPSAIGGFLDRTRPRHWYLIVATATTVILLLVAGYAILTRNPHPALSLIQETQDGRPSIAILPFINISDDLDKDYFCDGITEELINSLARIKDLRVISRTSAFYFKNKGFDLRTIGEKLGVDNVLEGSVRVSGDKLRISAQLIKVVDDSHLWSETYDREAKDIFDTQENIALEIACSLKSQLGCNEDKIISKHYTENVDAYNIYLKGRFLWNKQLHKEAIEHYERALKIDPNYALAYAGLADAYNRLAFWFFDSLEEYKPKAKLAAIKALEIDDTLSEAHTSMGMFKLHFEWDWKGAEDDFKKAISLNPGNAIAHTYYGHLLRATDRMKEAVAELTKAMEIDPLSRSVNVFYGMMLNVSGQVDKSIEHLKTVMEVFPDSPEATMLLGRIQVEVGNFEEGLKLLEHAIKVSNKNSPFPIAFLGYSYGISGKKEKAIGLLKEAIDRRTKGYFPTGLIALMNMGLGNKEEAFKWLQIAVAERNPANFSLRTVPMFKSLHTDPRWLELMRKMGHEE